MSTKKRKTKRPAKKVPTKPAEPSTANTAPQGFLHENWGKVLAFLITTAIIAPLSWHLKTCFEERTQQAKGFRDSLVALRVSDERLTQDFATLSQVIVGLTEYVNQKGTRISEVEKRNNQIESMAQITNAHCTEREEIYQKFRNSHVTLTRQFLLLKPVTGEPENEDWRGNCGLLLEMSQGVYSPKPAMIINDSEYRQEFLELQEPFATNYEKLITGLRASQRRRDSNAEKLVELIEEQNGNLARSCWDCLRILFRSGTK